MIFLFIFIDYKLVVFAGVLQKALRKTFFQGVLAGAQDEVPDARFAVLQGGGLALVHLLHYVDYVQVAHIIGDFHKGLLAKVGHLDAGHHAAVVHARFAG